jgi:hypothetical protein
LNQDNITHNFCECEVMWRSAEIFQIQIYNDTKYFIKNLKKIKLLVSLNEKLGEQKIDIVISSSRKREIERIALSEGIKL